MRNGNEMFLYILKAIKSSSLIENRQLVEQISFYIGFRVENSDGRIFDKCIKGALNSEHGPVVAFSRYCSCGKITKRNKVVERLGWEDPRRRRIVIS